MLRTTQVKTLMWDVNVLMHIPIVWAILDMLGARSGTDQIVAHEKVLQLWDRFCVDDLDDDRLLEALVHACGLKATAEELKGRLRDPFSFSTHNLKLAEFAGREGEILLTGNLGSSWAGYLMNATGISSLFSHFEFSSTRKPALLTHDPAFWNRILESAKLDPLHTLYVDSDPRVLDLVRDKGVLTIEYRNPGDLILELQNWGILPNDWGKDHAQWICVAVGYELQWVRLSAGRLTQNGIPTIVENDDLQCLFGEGHTMLAPARVLVPPSFEEQAREILLPVSGPDWTCPTCREKLEGQFNACWKCGSERPKASR